MKYVLVYFASSNNKSWTKKYIKKEEAKAAFLCEYIKKYNGKLFCKDYYSYKNFKKLYSIICMLEQEAKNLPL